MADQGRNLEQKLQALTLDLRALLHLAIWGSAAALALMIAVLSAYLTLRPQRAAIVVTDPASVPHGGAQPPTITPQSAARAAETESEMRRLSEVVLALGADRDRLAARVGSLERSLEDVTGALHRQPGMPPSTKPPLSAAISSPAGPAAVQLPMPLLRPHAAPQTEVVATPAAQPATAAEPPSGAPIAALQVDSTSVREAPDPATAGQLGADVGGATKFDALRALWHSAKSANPWLVRRPSTQSLPSARAGRTASI